MKTFSAPGEDPNVNNAVNQVLLNMELSQPGTDEYTTMVDNVTKLLKAKAESQEDSYPTWLPKPDTIALIVANLAGIVLVMNYEKAEIITTKAFGFVPKMLK